MEIKELIKVALESNNEKTKSLGEELQVLDIKVGAEKIQFSTPPGFELSEWQRLDNQLGNEKSIPVDKKITLDMILEDMISYLKNLVNGESDTLVEIFKSE